MTPSDARILIDFAGELGNETAGRRAVAREYLRMAVDEFVYQFSLWCGECNYGSYAVNGCCGALMFAEKYADCALETMEIE